MIPFITFYFYFMDTAYSHLPEIDFILLFIKFSSVSWFLFPPISTSPFFCFVSVFQVRDFLSIRGDPCCLFIFNSGLLGNHLTAPWESYQPLGLMEGWSGGDLAASLIEAQCQYIQTFLLSQSVSLGKISNLPPGSMNLTARILRPE